MNGSVNKGYDLGALAVEGLSATKASVGCLHEPYRYG